MPSASCEADLRYVPGLFSRSRCLRFSGATSRIRRGEAAQERPTILIDCVTLWVSNILFALPEPEDLTAFETAVRTEVNALLALMERSNCRWILVSGETGLGGIASDRISRNYCDGLGLANQLIAASARKVFLVVAGCSLVLAE